MSAGIYLHIPFCRSRCSYCDFATDVFKSEAAVERYVSALVKEIENYELGIANYEPETVNRKFEFSNQKSKIKNPSLIRFTSAAERLRFCRLRSSKKY